MQFHRARFEEDTFGTEFSEADYQNISKSQFQSSQLFLLGAPVHLTTGAAWWRLSRPGPCLLPPIPGRVHHTRHSHMCKLEMQGTQCPVTNRREQLVEKCVCLYPPDGQSWEEPQLPTPVAVVTVHPCTPCSLPALPPCPSPLPPEVTYLDEVLAQKPGPQALPSGEPKWRHRIMVITFTFIFKFLIFPHALGLPYESLRKLCS